MDGLISDIQKFSLHDGPGIRTTVFLKGCNMKCLWCQNPETISVKPQIAEYAAKCIGCGTCIDVCPNSAVHLNNGHRVVDKDKCKLCGACVERCPSGALTIIGVVREVNDVFAEIAADLPYYRNSGGGLTLSGGEPLLQSGFCSELLQRSWEAGIDTAIETNLSLPYERLEPMLPWLNRIFFDLKIMNNQAHKRFTGIGNKNILINSKRLDQEGIPMVVRTPLIPGITDSEENIAAIARWVSNLKNSCSYELLNFNSLTEAKYGPIGDEYSLQSARPLSEDQVKKLAQIAADNGVNVHYR